MLTIHPVSEGHEPLLAPGAIVVLQRLPLPLEFEHGVTLDTVLVRRALVNSRIKLADTHTLAENRGELVQERVCIKRSHVAGGVRLATNSLKPYSRCVTYSAACNAHTKASIRRPTTEQKQRSAGSWRCSSGAVGDCGLGGS